MNTTSDNLKNNEFEILTSELKQALEERFTSSNRNLYPLDILSTMEQFKNTFLPSSSNSNNDTLNPLQEENYQNFSPEVMPQQENQKVNPLNQQPLPSKNDTRSSSHLTENNGSLITSPASTTSFDSMLEQSTQDFKKSAERERQQIIKENKQINIAKNLQHAAVQKAIADKAAAEKGILSSIAEAVLGEWWTGEKSSTKTMTQFKEQQNASLTTMINDILNPITDEPLTTDEKDMLKTAYYQCQDILISFNAKEYWNTEAQEPTQSWQEKIRKPLSLLIRYDVVTINDVITILHNTLKSKVMGDKLEALEEKTKMFLTHEKKAAFEEKAHYTQEKEREKQRIKHAEAQALEKQKQELIDRQNEALRKEKEHLERMENVAMQRLEAQDAMIKLEREWKNFLKTVATSTNASVEQNDTWTQEALNKTQQLVSLAPIAQIDLKEIITKRKADFSRALLEQKKGSELGISATRNIEEFNKRVHQL